jgi:hypothetical protein
VRDAALDELELLLVVEAEVGGADAEGVDVDGPLPVVTVQVLTAAVDSRSSSAIASVVRFSRGDAEVI